MIKKGVSQGAKFMYKKVFAQKPSKWLTSISTFHNKGPNFQDLKNLKNQFRNEPARAEIRFFTT